jgi:hypothetical protein
MNIPNKHPRDHYYFSQNGVSRERTCARNFLEQKRATFYCKETAGFPNCEQLELAAARTFATFDICADRLRTKRF